MRLILTTLANNIANLFIGLLTAAFLGPNAFGRFAMAMLIAATLQILAFDWLKLAGSRFYSDKVHHENALWRASLDRLFGAMCLTVTMGAVLWMAYGTTIMGRGMIALAVVLAMSNGLFDYSAALIRARFRDDIYTRMVVVKSLISTVLTVGLAYYTGDEHAPLLGLICATLAGVIFNWRWIAHPLSDFRAFDKPFALRTAAYSLPLITSVFLITAMALTNRGIIAFMNGYGEAGRFALPYDLGTRIIGALGLSFDFIFFQYAVRLDQQSGIAQALTQLRLNVTLLMALLTPACLGLWLILPQFEALMIAREYQGSFADYFMIVLPGFYIMYLMQYGINPFFQIHQTTRPIIVASVIGIISNLALIFITGDRITPSEIAIFQSCGYGMACLVLLAFAIYQGALLPDIIDVVKMLLALLVMSAALWPLRALSPDPLILGLMIMIGVLTYSLCLWLMNFCDLKSYVNKILPSERTHF
jgi:O-antigen/teichoic acid export membrane protein